MAENKSKMGMGLVIGSVIGGLAAFFLTPKSGKENRELVSKKIMEIKTMIEEKQIQARVKEIYGEVTEEGTRVYTMAREKLDSRLDEVKKSVDEISMEKYRSIVEDVISKVKEETQESTERLAKLHQYFISRWNMAKEEVKHDSKKVAGAAMETEHKHKVEDEA
jgi:gas vesicle protein